MTRFVRAAAGAFLPAIMVAIPMLAVPAPAAAQVPTLDRVDSLVTAGDYDSARANLDRWWSAREAFDVPGSDRVRALMLRAGLQTSPEEAEADYLAVILGYPTSGPAPTALLRLGQGLVATGQHARAAGYLQRLVADYPGRPERTTAILWLARAQYGARRAAAACQTARQGIASGSGGPEFAALLRIEEAAACDAARSADAVAAEPRTDAATETEAAPADARPAPADDPAEDAPSPAEEASRPEEPRAPDEAAGEAATGRYTVQTGAFRYREGADALMARLRDRGHESRLVLIPANDLLRVRVGRFENAGPAARLVATLKDAGFDAYVVTDAHQERRP